MISYYCTLLYPFSPPRPLLCETHTQSQVKRPQRPIGEPLLVPLQAAVSDNASLVGTLLECSVAFLPWVGG